MKFRLGSSRVVLVFRGFVVKFPLPVSIKRFCLGVVANYRESEVNYYLVAKSYFCLFGLLLVQERLYCVGSTEVHPYVRSKVQGVFRLSVGELHDNNFGQDCDGNVKICDLGVDLSDGVSKKKEGRFHLWLRVIKRKWFT